jgi:hypothetical protein
MRKIRLDLEALEVESFDTGDGQPPRGTVQGLGATHTCDLQCNNTPNGTCDGGMTCLLWDTCLESNCGYYSCAYTCPPSAGETCDPSCNYCLQSGSPTCRCPDIREP